MRISAAATSLILAASLMASHAAPAQKTIWWAGAWQVTFQGDEFERHYTLEAVLRPEEKTAPAIILRCVDGRFTVDIFMMFNRTSEKPSAVIFLADNGERAIFPVHSFTGIMLDEIPASRAETLIVNTKRLGVRLKYPSGRNADAQYPIKNLAVGKPQLFNVCPPPRRPTRRARTGDGQTGAAVQPEAYALRVSAARHHRREEKFDPPANPAAGGRRISRMYRTGIWQSLRLSFRARMRIATLDEPLAEDTIFLTAGQ